MSRHTINRWYAAGFALLFLLGTQLPVSAQFSAQIQIALQTLGIWPYDGSYTDGSVPTWSVASNKFLPGGGSGGGTITTGSVTFSGGNILDGTLPNRIVDRNGTNAKRFDVANTWASTISNETFSVDWQTTANVALVGTRTAATGTSRTMRLVSQAANASDDYAMLEIGRSNPGFTLGMSNAAGAFSGGTANAIDFIQMARYSNMATSGTVRAVTIIPTYNQASGNAANTDLLINRTQTAVGSGAQYLIDTQVSGVSQFSVSNGGAVKFNGTLTPITGTTIIGSTTTVTTTTSTDVLKGTGTGTSVANVGANSCGTTAASVAGNQVSGVITVGATAGTQCRVTFTTAAPVARDCTVTDSTTTIATRATVVDTTNTDFLGAFAAGDKITYHCVVR